MANLNDLCPALQRIVPQFVLMCKEKGITVKILTTYRDAKTQNAVASLGLSRAKAGQSPHNCLNEAGKPYSKAFDFGVFVDGDYVKDGGDPYYTECGAIGKKLFLEWGGDFKSIFDPSHLELMNWRTNAGA